MNSYSLICLASLSAGNSETFPYWRHRWCRCRLSTVFQWWLPDDRLVSHADGSDVPMFSHVFPCLLYLDSQMLTPDVNHLQVYRNCMWFPRSLTMPCHELLHVPACCSQVQGLKDLRRDGWNWETCETKRVVFVAIGRKLQGPESQCTSVSIHCTLWRPGKQHSNDIETYWNEFRMEHGTNYYKLLQEPIRKQRNLQPSLKSERLFGWIPFADFGVE